MTVIGSGFTVNENGLTVLLGALDMSRSASIGLMKEETYIL